MALGLNMLRQLTPIVGWIVDGVGVWLWVSPVIYWHIIIDEVNGWARFLVSIGSSLIFLLLFLQGIHAFRIICDHVTSPRL